MTPTEYRTLREACGLSAREAAEFHQVAERTIVHRETGRNGIPDGAAEELRALNATIERGVENALTRVAELAGEHGEPDTVALTRYRTPESYAGSRPAREGLLHSCHNALVARTMLAMQRIGCVVTISWG
jgi:hypothetical protein